MPELPEQDGNGATVVKFHMDSDEGGRAETTRDSVISNRRSSKS